MSYYEDDTEMELGDDPNRPRRRWRFNFPLGLGGLFILVVLIGAGYIMLTNIAPPMAAEEPTPTPTLARLNTPTPDPNYTPVPPTPMPLPDVPVLDDTNRAGVSNRLRVEFGPVERLSRGAAELAVWLPDGSGLLVSAGKTLNWHSLPIYDHYSERTLPAEVIGLLGANSANGDGTLYVALADGAILAMSLGGDVRQVLFDGDGLVRDFQPERMILALSPDGRWLAASPGHYSTLLLDLTGEIEPRVLGSNAPPDLSSPGDPILNLAFDPESQRLMVFEQPGIRCQFDVLAATNGSRGTCQSLPLRGTPVWGGSRISQIAYHSPTGWLAVTDRIGRLFIMRWNDNEPRPIEVMRCAGCPNPAEYLVTDLAFSDDGNRLAIGTSVGLFVVSVPDGELVYQHVQPMAALAPPVQHMAFGWRNQLLAVVSTTGVVEIFSLIDDPMTPNPMALLSEYKGRVADMSYSTGQLAVGYQSGVVQLWQLGLGSPLLNDTLRIPGYLAEVGHANWGEHLVVLRYTPHGNDPDPFTFPLSLTGQTVTVFDSSGYGSTLTPNLRQARVMLAENNVLRLYRLDEKTFDWSIDGYARQMLFTPFNRYLLAASHPNVFDYIDTWMGLRLGQLGVPDAYAPFVQSSGGVVMQRGNTVLYRYLIQMRAVTQWTEVPEGTALAVSDDGTLVAVGSNDGSLKFYWAANLAALEPADVAPDLTDAAITHVEIRRGVVNEYHAVFSDANGALYSVQINLVSADSSQ